MKIDLSDIDGIKERLEDAENVIYLVRHAVGKGFKPTAYEALKKYYEKYGDPDESINTD